MSIWLQKSASIQPRTSLLKFDDLARTKVRYRILHLEARLSRRLCCQRCSAKAPLLTLGARFDIEPYSEPNHQTVEGSFSAVSKPIFATKYSFFSIFRDLIDLSAFAPVRIQNFSKKLVTILVKMNRMNKLFIRAFSNFA